MNLKAITDRKLLKPALVAGITALCGLLLWGLPLRELWENGSYDYLFRFGPRAVTNKVAIVLMDNAACYELGQTRTNWNRGLHAALLDRLAQDHCPLVVFDILFREARDRETDDALAEAMRRHGHVVLMAKVTDPKAPIVEAAQVVRPNKVFLDAATNVGIGQAEVGTARRHWPFPASNERDFPSLGWVAARLVGASLNEKPAEQWLRYYGEKGAWETFSYHLALSNAPGAFAGKIVFIGSGPQQEEAGIFEEDKFLTPYTRRTRTAVGGVEIMATTFLNLVNGDWLRRAPAGIEAMVLVGTGILLGGGLSRARPLIACGLALFAGLTVTFAAVWLSFFTNYWFPWLIVVGGQVPCALACSVVASQFRPTQKLPSKTVVVDARLLQPSVVAELPDAPDYELFDPPFGQGAYGKVWLARNAIGQWQALKAVYLARFAPYKEPYEREFNGIKRYKPVSVKHPGLLPIDFVSTKKDAGYFYYVMELGDALEPGWEQNPRAYKPRDLATVRARAPGGRLPVQECVRIGVVLAEALEFLHEQGLTHRDIKPQNVIFVNDRPKLADVGLTAELRPAGQENTSVGTLGYMPPEPEPAGTIQADIYGLGMMLYVIRTGREPDRFPEVSSTLIEGSQQSDFIPLNSVILKACQPDRTKRFVSAGQMRAALLEIAKGLR